MPIVMYCCVVVLTFHVYFLAPTDKIALVIGNLYYKKKQFNNLSYTLNDAFDIAAALTKQNFKARPFFNPIAVL